MELEKARRRILERADLNAFISVSSEEGTGTVVAVKDLVENKHVIAFVAQMASSTHQGAAKYLAQKRVPVVGDGDGTAAIAWDSLDAPARAKYLGLLPERLKAEIMRVCVGKETDDLDPSASPRS